jgi:predicted dehydrogenase
MGDDGLPGVSGGTPLRVGIIGAGFIGVVHARAARRAGARIVGVAASTAASTAAAAVAMGAEQLFTSGEALVESDQIDVVHVCTPNHLHHSLGRAALHAGKHVVCEKPLATSRDAAHDLVATAAGTGLVATVPFAYRFYPMVREARARLRAGDEPIRLVYGNYLQDWLSTAQDDNWRVDASLSGPSRAFADIGSHWCDLVEFVTGDRMAEVNAVMVTAIGERSARGLHAHAFSPPESGGADDVTKVVTTEDVAMAMFRTTGGATGSMIISQISSGHKNQLRFEIVGPGESIAFDQEHPDTLWIGRRAGTELLAADPTRLHPEAAAYAMVPAGHPHGYQDCFDSFVADTYRAIGRGGTSTVDGLPTFSDGARAADLTAAVLESARTGRWVDVTPRASSAAEPTRTESDKEHIA